MTHDGLGDPLMVNVVPVTPIELRVVEALLGALHHGLHDGYDWRSCAACRRVEAERVSARFPSYRATGFHPDRTTL